MMFGDADEYFKVGIQGSYLILEYKLENSNKVTLSANYTISDSKSYMAEVKEHESDITLTLYDSEKVMEYKSINGTKPVPAKNYLNDIVQNANTEVVLGTRVSGVDVPANIYAYHGCLQEVRIGGILLPFFTDEQFINNTSKEKFLLQPNNQFTSGCQAGIGCQRNQCQHSSVCVADFYSYVCECSTGYTGRWCQDRIDYCVEDPCMNGQCVSNLDQFECRCSNTGYTGTRLELLSLKLIYFQSMTLTTCLMSGRIVLDKLMIIILFVKYEVKKQILPFFYLPNHKLKSFTDIKNS